MAKEKPSVFINYRRALCTKEARLLYLMLDARFPGALFQDEATLKAGDEWLPKIRESIESAKVMLVLIPPRWVSYAVDLDFYTKNPDCIHDGLIHRPNDIVRMEIEAGLKTEGLTIIPILLNGAQKPLDNQMPASIRPLFEKFNIANKGQALDFSQPDIDQFKALFAQIAEKAGIEQQVDAHDNIFQPTLKKEYPLDDELLPEAESPFIGLKPFKREHARLFFGRNREIFNLCFKLFEAPKPRLLLLDGYSGTGKSSLLQAGLIPRIEAQRWGWAYGRREDDPVNGLRGVFDGLLEKLKKEGNGKSVLILDQVEEAVTDKIEGLPDELEAFAAALQAAFGEHPGYKFIIGFRSEQATRIKKILNDHRIPFDDENTLFPLDRVGAAEAISGAAEELHQRYDLEFKPRNLPYEIADRLLQGRDNYFVAPLLQVNMELLWERCKQADGSVVITSHALENFIDKQDELLDHYIRKIREAITEGQADDQKILQLLNFYVQDEPASATRLDTELSGVKEFEQEKKVFSELHRELKKQYLLTEISNDGQRATRLSHDVLARVIHGRYKTLTEARLRETRTGFFDRLIVDLRNQIYGLQYSEAQDTLARIFELDIRREELRPYLFELLFFWNETGRHEPAQQTLRYWLDSHILSEKLTLEAGQLGPEPARDDLRDWLKKTDPGRYADMRKKYFAPMDAVMVKIPGGRPGISTDEEKRQIEVDTFYLSNVQTTFHKYGIYLFAEGREKDLKDMAPSWGLYGDHPVVKIRWYDAVEYCNWLSRMEGKSEAYVINKTVKDPANINKEDQLKWLVTVNDKANGYRLPTETEWEFAARGGNQSKGFKYAGSNDPAEVAWSWENSGRKTHPVGNLKPNELGLLDMSGNVLEWCWDWYADYPKPLPRNYAGADKGTGRVLRGGSWSDSNIDCQVSVRYWYVPNDRFDSWGFRLAQDSL